jgi:ribosomal protein S18 acetylase RimI-like enzyme
MPKLTIRKPHQEELLQVGKLIIRSANDLRVKSGRKPWDTNITEVPPLSQYIYETDPDGHKCAYYDNKIVGFSAALVRGKQWYLGDLFIEPAFQLKGVGRKLLEHAFAYGGKADSHALCTFPYNETALALYSSFGMMPTSPLLEMQKKIEKPEDIAPSGLRAEEDNSLKSILLINKLEKEIRGYPHLIDWRFFARDSKHKIYHFYDRAKWVGYSVILGGKLVAPAGAIEPQYLPDIISESYRISVQSGADFCRLWIGGPNAALYQRLKSHGFRINEMSVFLSTKPYGDFSRYCPAHLTVF